jgi:hypothetical protein
MERDWLAQAMATFAVLGLPALVLAVFTGLLLAATRRARPAVLVFLSNRPSRPPAGFPPSGGVASRRP